MEALDAFLLAELLAEHKEEDRRRRQNSAPEASTVLWQWAGIALVVLGVALIIHSEWG
jgi:hypothetical protein